MQISLLKSVAEAFGLHAFEEVGREGRTDGQKEMGGKRDAKSRLKACPIADNPLLSLLVSFISLLNPHSSLPPRWRSAKQSRALPAWTSWNSPLRTTSSPALICGRERGMERRRRGEDVEGPLLLDNRIEWKPLKQLHFSPSLPPSLPLSLISPSIPQAVQADDYFLLGGQSGLPRPAYQDSRCVRFLSFLDSFILPCFTPSLPFQSPSHLIHSRDLFPSLLLFPFSVK